LTYDCRVSDIFPNARRHEPEANWMIFVRIGDTFDNRLHARSISLSRTFILSSRRILYLVIPSISSRHLVVSSPRHLVIQSHISSFLSSRRFSHRYYCPRNRNTNFDQTPSRTETLDTFDQFSHHASSKLHSGGRLPSLS